MNFKDLVVAVQKIQAEWLDTGRVEDLLNRHPDGEIPIFAVAKNGTHYSVNSVGLGCMAAHPVIRVNVDIPQ